MGRMVEMVEKMIRKTIERINPYVPGKPIEEVQRELGLSKIIKLASNENAFGASEKAIGAIKEQAEGIHIYPDANGYELKKELASHYNLNPENFILGNGSDENIKLVAEAFVNPGEEIVFCNPSFLAYDFAAKVMDGTVKDIPLKEFCFDLDGILNSITDKTKLVFICNPNNPTGTIVPKKEVDEFLAKVPEHVIVVFDEAYVQYVENTDFSDAIPYVKEGKKVIVLRTFSKIYGLAGIRIGYGISSPEIISYIERVREPFNVNILAQAGAIAAIKDQDHVHSCREQNLAGKKFLTSQFREMGLTWVESETNFILVDVGVDAQALHQEMLQQGVIIRPGHVFKLPQHIRVTIGTKEENELFINVLKNAIKKVG